MRCVVFGGAGFIGSRLARALLSSSVSELVIADNLSGPQSLWLISALLDDPRVRFVRMDIRKRETFSQLTPGPYDRVYHLAASFANELSESAPQLDFDTNVTGTANVIRFAHDTASKHLIYSGSSSSYGASLAALSEHGPMNPQTAYARNKLLGEQLVQEASLPWSIFRLFNVYGPGDYSGPNRNVIPNMMAALCAGTPLHLLGQGCTRDFNLIDDLLPVLCAPEVASGQVLNLSGGRETSIETMVQLLLSVAGRPKYPVVHGPLRSWDRVHRRVADVSALEGIYDSVARTTLRDGLAQTWRWFKTNQKQVGVQSNPWSDSSPEYERRAPPRSHLSGLV